MNFYNRVFAYNFEVLRILGLWNFTGRNEKASWFYCFGQFLALFFLFTATVLSVIDFILSLHDFRKLVVNLSVTLSICCTFFKSNLFLKNLNGMDDLRRELNRDLSEEPGENCTILISAATEMQQTLKYTFSALYVLVTAVVVVPLFIFEDNSLPVQMWMPFDMYSRPLYYVIYIYQVILCFYFSTAIILSNSSTVGFIIRISAEFSILNAEIREYYRRFAREFDDVAAKAELRKLIRRHQKIIRFVDRFHKVHGKPLLIQLVGSTTLFIALGLEIAVLSTSVSMRLMVQIGYMVLALVDLFLYCYYGTRLIETGEQIGYTIFESEWFLMPPSYRRYFAFIIHRSQKFPKVVIGKIFIVNFHLFLEILKVTYNLLAVMVQLAIKNQT